MVSLCELNARLLTRVNTAERAAERLRASRTVDTAAITTMQTKLTSLEHCVAEKESELSAVRALAAEIESARSMSYTRSWKSGTRSWKS